VEERALYLKQRYAMKVGFERGLAKKTWMITWKKGDIAKTATAAAMKAIVQEDESTSEMK
jgi:hypothetical protein